MEPKVKNIKILLSYRADMTNPQMIDRGRGTAGKQDVFIIGATGNVGRTLVRQIFERGDTDNGRHANPTRIVGLASSRKFVFSSYGLTEALCYGFADKKEEGIECRAYANLDEILRTVIDGYRGAQETCAFVDVTAVNEAMLGFHQNVINNTSFGIVTANKNPIAQSNCRQFSELTKMPGRYGYRCSVMAGAEAVTLLQDLKDVNDSPTRIRGCFSGTLGYINSELDKGGRFSDIVKEAKEKGYTEPDPRTDLGGFDVARKLVVLARTAGFAVELTDIEVEPFVPKEYLSHGSVGDFLISIKQSKE